MSAPRRRKPRKRGLTRRSFLRGAGAGAAALAASPLLPGCGDSALPSLSLSEPGVPDPVFLHGVASGDPLSDRVILWTRVTAAAAGPMPVRYVLAADPSMAQIVRDGEAQATAGRDFTVKIDVTGLQPATTYYYRFEALGQRSPVGRTRTLPVGTLDRLRIAVVSCASFAHGVFNAYRRVAERADLDVVLHLGDYITSTAPAPTARRSTATRASTSRRPRSCRSPTTACATPSTSATRTSAPCIGSTP